MPADRVCRLLAFIFERSRVQAVVARLVEGIRCRDVVFGCVAQFLQSWLATTDLGHDREGLFAIIRKTAISCIIAIPACG